MPMTVVLAEPLAPANRTQNGVLLIVLGVFIVLLFVAFAVPAIKRRKEKPLVKQGSAMGRVLVAGPGGIALIVTGIVVLLGG